MLGSYPSTEAGRGDPASRAAPCQPPSAPPPPGGLGAREELSSLRRPEQKHQDRPCVGCCLLEVGCQSLPITTACTQAGRVRDTAGVALGGRGRLFLRNQLAFLRMSDSCFFPSGCSGSF